MKRAGPLWFMNQIKAQCKNTSDNSVSTDRVGDLELEGTDEKGIMARLL